uniref:ribonuclease H n=1 Tax=Lates calcarifer TaxID=8187 RepID=A0A4W6FV19_LATCA
MDSTPSRPNSARGTRRASSDGGCRMSKPTGRLLNRRWSPRGDQTPGTPRGPRFLARVKRALFTPSKDKAGMTFLCANKTWRQNMSQGRLPKMVKVGLRVPWASQSCRLCDIELGSLREARTHLIRIHRPWKVFYRCSRCAGTFAHLPSVVCHVPKCTPRQTTTPADPGHYRCDLCTKVFSSSRGYSNHRRSKHTAAYLREKQGSQLKERNGNSHWSKEDTASLRQMIDEEGNSPGLYAKAAARFPTMTPRQIREKCRLIRASARTSVVKSPTTHNANQDLRDLEVELPPQPSVAVLKEALEAQLTGGEGDEGLDPLHCSGRDLNRYVRKVIRLLCRQTPKVLGGKIKRTSPGNPKRLKQSKRFRYKIMQTRYRRDRPTLARWILDGKEKSECPISRAEVASGYKRIWEAGDSFKGLGGFAAMPPADNSPLCVPISAEEALRAVRRMDPKGAPGPDGLRRSDLLRWDNKGRKLANLFNTILHKGKLPSCLKRSRTTLIPKSSDSAKLADLSQWRPITIGSVMLRAFSGILARRLKEACPVHTRQRGFIESPGCSENLLLMDGLLRIAKKEVRPLAVVFVDFAKAFDSVSHQHIAEVLTRKGVDEWMRKLIQDSYKGCTTVVRTKHGETDRIHIKVGVKQGDPLSPLLFNLALDPLLYVLENKGVGFRVGGRSLTALAFADDLVLLSDSWKGMERNLQILEIFSSLTGLKVNPSKCHGFMLDKSQRRYTINDCEVWKLAGTPIHMVPGHEAVTYLGVQISPAKGILTPPLRTLVKDMVARITRAELKPSQKVEILRTYALPRLIYMADHGMACGSLLDGCDRDIRSAVKGWLHLEPHTTDGVCYASFQDGGLGLIKLAAHIPTVQLRRIMAMYNSTDECTKSVARATMPVSNIWALWNRVRGIKRSGDHSRPDLNAIDLKEASTAAWRGREFGRWCKLKTQGVGIEVFRADKISNSWLREPTGARFHESEMIMGLQLRTCTFPTLSSRVRGRGRTHDALLCRLCGRQQETIRHIIGNCVSVKPNRMANHNKICGFLQRVAEEAGWLVARERRLVSDSGSVGVPDLVMVKGREAIILDVAICFEANQDTLYDSEVRKIKKYSGFTMAVKTIHPDVRNVSVCGFPMGARGKWHKNNTAILTKLGVSKKRAKQLAVVMSRRALLQTVDTCKVFRALARRQRVPR